MRRPTRPRAATDPVTGQEVQFNVTFPAPFNLDLPADHYFFVPQVSITSTGDFLWLSRRPSRSCRPAPPSLPTFESWTRDSNLDPDWLRIGTDIVGGSPGTTFNAAFSLTGETFTPQITSLSQTSAVEGSGDTASDRRREQLHQLLDDPLQWPGAHDDLR